MRGWIAVALLLASPALAADGDACASQSYRTFTNAAACVVACDEVATERACGGGTGFAPPSGYRGGAVRVEIAQAAATCAVRLREGSSDSDPRWLDDLFCDGERGWTLPAGHGVAGRLYLEFFEAGADPHDVRVPGGVGDD